MLTDAEDEGSEDADDELNAFAIELDDFIETIDGDIEEEPQDPQVQFTRVSEAFRY